MALIFCPECGTKISEHAEMCVNCSYPIYKLKQNSENISTKVVKIKVDNTVIWILAFAPLLGAILQELIAQFVYGYSWGYYYDKFWMVTLILNIILCIVDENKLKKQNIETDDLGSTWLVPIYLYRRAKKLGHDLAYFWIWIVLFALDFFSFW